MIGDYYGLYLLCVTTDANGSSTAPGRGRAIESHHRSRKTTAGGGPSSSRRAPKVRDERPGRVLSQHCTAAAAMKIKPLAATTGSGVKIETSRRARGWIAGWIGLARRGEGRAHAMYLARSGSGVRARQHEKGPHERIHDPPARARRCRRSQRASDSLFGHAARSS